MNNKKKNHLFGYEYASFEEISLSEFNATFLFAVQSDFPLTARISTDNVSKRKYVLYIN